MQCKLLAAVPVRGAQTSAVNLFLAWVKQYQPNAYAAIMRSGLADSSVIAKGLSGIYGHSVTPSVVPSTLRDSVKANSLLQGLAQGAVTPSGDASTPSTDWGTTISNFTSGILTTLNQQRLFNMQLSRAEKGLPPLNVDAVGVPVNVGVSAGVQQLLTYGLIGTGIYFVARLLLR
jgi:hypothetical protein